MAGKTRPQINVRARTEQIARWKEAANPAGSFNAWAVAALDAAAGNGHPAAAEPKTSARLLHPSELEEAEAADRFDRDSADLSLAGLPDLEQATRKLETAIDNLSETDSPKAQKSRAGRCARRRFHRPGTYCKSCRTMT